MLEIQIFIRINTIGSDAGLFSIYQNSDSYTTPISTGVTRQQLLDGIIITVSSSSVDVKVISDAPCNNELVIPISTCKEYKLEPEPGPSPGSTTFSYIPCGLTSSTEITVDFFDFVCAVENTVSIVSGNGTFSILGDCTSPTTTTSTTTTTTSQQLLQGLISTSSIEEDISAPDQPNGNPCALQLSVTVWIEGYPSYARVFNDSGGGLPFNGQDRFWHLKYIIDSASVSAKITFDGTITSGVSICQ